MKFGILYLKNDYKNAPHHLWRRAYKKVIRHWEFPSFVEVLREVSFEALQAVFDVRRRQLPPSL